MRLVENKDQKGRKKRKITELGVSHYSRTALFDYVNNNSGGDKMHVALVGAIIASETKTLSLKSYELSRLWNALYIIPGRRRRRLKEILAIIKKSQDILKLEKVGKKDFVVTPNEIFYKNLLGHEEKKKDLCYSKFDFSQVKFYFKHILQTLRSSKMPINGPVSNISMGILLWLLNAKKTKQCVTGHITLGRIKQFSANSAISKYRDYGRLLDISSVCFQSAKEIGLISRFDHEQRGKFIINGRLSFEILAEPQRAKTPFDSKKGFFRKSYPTGPVLPTREIKDEDCTKPPKFAKYLSSAQEMRIEKIKKNSRAEGKNELQPLKALLQNLTHDQDTVGPSP